MFNDGWLKLFLKQGKKFAANARARSGRVTVRGVLAPFLFLGAKICSQLAPANMQQGPNDGTSDRMDSAEAGEPRSAQDVRKHGFRLVVSRVCNGDARERSRFHQRAEIIVARAACRVLQIGAFLLGFLCNVNGSRVKLQSMFRRKLSDELFVGVRRFAAQFVVEVNDTKHNAKFFVELLQ